MRTYSSDYITVTARMAVLKAKAVCSCQLHPEIFILCENEDAKERAYLIAKNTLVYHDKMFLLESLSEAVRLELSLANVECTKCVRNIRA